MRASGMTAATCVNGTAMISRGRAAARSCVTVIVAPAANTLELSATMATPREINFMFPPPAAAGKIFSAAIVAYSGAVGFGACLRHHDRRIDHGPERPFRIAGRIEEQRTVGARHRVGVEPGVIVRDAPEAHGLHAGPVERIEQRAIQ